MRDMLIPYGLLLALALAPVLAFADWVWCSHSAAGLGRGGAAGGRVLNVGGLLMRDLLILAGLVLALMAGWWLAVPRGVTEPTPPPPAREVVR